MEVRLTPEIWYIISGMNLERKEINSLIKASKFHRNVLQPFLYRNVDLTKSSRESQNATLGLIDSDPTLARHVLAVTLPSYPPWDEHFDHDQDPIPPPDLALFTNAFRRMISLRSFTVAQHHSFWGKSDNTGGDLARFVLGEDAFIRTFLEREVQLKHFTWCRVDPEKFGRLAHWATEKSGKLDYTPGHFRDIWKFLDACSGSLETLDLPVYMRNNGIADSCAPLWLMRFPLLRKVILPSWVQLFPNTAQVKEWCLFHAKKPIFYHFGVGDVNPVRMVASFSSEGSGVKAQLVLRALADIDPRGLALLAKKYGTRITGTLKSLHLNIRGSSPSTRASGTLALEPAVRDSLSVTLDEMEKALETIPGPNPRGEILDLDHFAVSFHPEDVLWKEVTSYRMAQHIRRLSRIAGPNLRSWAGISPPLIQITAEQLAYALSHSHRLEELTIDEYTLAQEDGSPEDYALTLARRLQCFRRFVIRPVGPPTEPDHSTLDGALQLLIGRKAESNAPFIETRL